MIPTVFLGYGEYGAASLSGLIAGGCAPLLVVTHSRSSDNQVAALARDHRIELAVAGRRELRGLAPQVRALRPEYLVSTNWRFTIPDEILHIPEKYPINVHDSLLPDYAGLSAEHWVIREGASRTGVTVHLMTAEMDAGPIVTQWALRLDDSDTGASVARRQLERYPIVVVDAIARLETTGFAPRRVEPWRYRRYHKIIDQDRQIDWQLPPQQLLNLLRAHDAPDPGCYFKWNGQRFTAREADLPIGSLCGAPGRVVTCGPDGLGVATGPTGHDGTAKRGLLIRVIEDVQGGRWTPSDVIPLNAQLA